MLVGQHDTLEPGPGRTVVGEEGAVDHRSAGVAQVDHPRRHPGPLEGRGDRLDLEKPSVSTSTRRSTRTPAAWAGVAASPPVSSNTTQTTTTRAYRHAATRHATGHVTSGQEGSAPRRNPPGRARAPRRVISSRPHVNPPVSGAPAATMPSACSRSQSPEQECPRCGCCPTPDTSPAAVPRYHGMIRIDASHQLWVRPGGPADVVAHGTRSSPTPDRDLPRPGGQLLRRPLQLPCTTSRSRAPRDDARIYIARIRRGGTVEDAAADTVVRPGDTVVVTARGRSLLEAGLDSSLREVDKDHELLDFLIEDLTIVATSAEVVGRTVGYLREHPLSRRLLPQVDQSPRRHGRPRNCRRRGSTRATSCGCSGLQQYGLGLFFAGLVVTLTPLVAGTLLARYVFTFDPVLTLGILAGAQTTTAAVGAVGVGAQPGPVARLHRALRRRQRPAHRRRRGRRRARSRSRHPAVEEHRHMTVEHISRAAIAQLQVLSPFELKSELGKLAGEHEKRTAFQMLNARNRVNTQLHRPDAARCVLTLGRFALDKYHHHHWDPELVGVSGRTVSPSIRSWLSTHATSGNFFFFFGG